MSRKFFEQIKIPATKLQNGKMMVMPTNDYPPMIVEWLDQFVFIRETHAGFEFKVCATEDEMNDVYGWSTAYEAESEARIAGILSAQHMVGDSAWQYAKNPPESSVYYGNQYGD